MAFDDGIGGWLERLAAQAQTGRASIANAGGVTPLADAVASPVAPMPAPRLAPAPPTDPLSAPSVGAGVGDAGHVDPEFHRRLAALVAASNGRISIGNDYRSTARQAQLFAAAVKKYGSVAAARKWVAPPGHSQHNRGLAADLKGDMALAHQLAGQFGLVFPMGHEPWHIEERGARG